MIIGVPKERKQGERRVAVTPDGAQLLSANGHRVRIETGAGAASGFSDAEYRESGAEIVATLDEVWKTAELLVKVKEPAAEELPLFRPGLGVFSFLHPAVAPEMMRALLTHQVVGVDYDLVMEDSGRLPILEPMSVIAGKLAVQCAAHALQAASGGAGILLGGCSGVAPAHVVVIGAGAAGRSAAEVALGMGAHVTVLDKNTDRLAGFSGGYFRANTLASSPAALARAVKSADVVIGAVLIPGALAPKLLPEPLVASMNPGSVIVDICIDQGGCAATSRATSIAEPTYVTHGVVHYCVPNMPALVPRTSTLALTNATLPWLLQLAQRGLDGAVKELAPLHRSVVSYAGKLTNRAIGEALEIPYCSLGSLQ